MLGHVFTALGYQSQCCYEGRFAPFPGKVLLKLTLCDVFTLVTLVLIIGVGD